MKKIFTFLSFLSLQISFSQTELFFLPKSETEVKSDLAPSKFQLLISCLPELSEESTELNFNLEVKGTYSFVLDPSLLIPDNVSILLKDAGNENSFDLRSKEPHTFSVNRSMTKKFILQISKSESLSLGEQIH